MYISLYIDNKSFIACVLILRFVFRVVFNEVVKTNKEYMQDITAIEPEWLYTLAGHYYQYGTVCFIHYKERIVMVN